MKLSTFYDDPTAENMAELPTHFVHDPSPGAAPFGKVMKFASAYPARRRLR